MITIVQFLNSSFQPLSRRASVAVSKTFEGQ